MKSKKPRDSDTHDQDNDLQKIEDKVRRMLDPSVPDPEADIPSDLPTEIKISEPQTLTAPELQIDKRAENIIVQTVDDEQEKVFATNSKSVDTEKNVSPPPVVVSTEEPELEDSATAKAVDEIAHQESDELLAAEDKEIAKAFEDKKLTLFGRIKRFFGDWWHNTLARRLTIAVLTIGLIAAITMPTSRYFLLNSFGVRSGASVKVLDQSTRQPLKNVQVGLMGETVLTDNDGVAQFNKIKLGATELVIEKQAFAPVRQPVTLGWGSNPLGDRNLTPVGSQYSFSVSDYLSGSPLAKIEATSDDAAAFSDEHGKIKLTIDKTDDSPIEVKITGEDLREETLTIDADDKSEHVLTMVPNRKHAFISKRSGKYDVYKIDVDGKNEELVLAGTGSERDDMVLLSHPTKELVALVSTRGNVRNRDRYLLSKLTIIDLSDNSTVEAAQSERIQAIDWIDDRVVYVQIAASTSAADPRRHRLMSYDQDMDENSELASSNFFNDVMVARGYVFYAPSSAYQTESVSLYKIKADGSNRQTALVDETWNMYRTSYDNLTLSLGQNWYEYNLTKNSSNKLPGEPANLRSRLYANSPNAKRSLWVDQRDGKGVLLAYDISKNEDQEIHQRSGLKSPVRWLNNNSVVFRTSTDQETADYAVSLDGGEPKKIRDVTNTADITDWYYY